MMWKRIMSIIFIGVLLLGVGTACQKQTPIETEKQAGEQTITIGEDVNDVGALLKDIDGDLG